jgi:hypothetical protein
METIIIKPKDKSELKFFIELANRLGIDVITEESDADEWLFQAMEKNKKTSKIDKTAVVETIQKILED